MLQYVSATRIGLLTIVCIAAVTALSGHRRDSANAAPPPAVAQPPAPADQDAPSTSTPRAEEPAPSSDAPVANPEEDAVPPTPPQGVPQSPPDEVDAPASPAQPAVPHFIVPEEQTPGGDPGGSPEGGEPEAPIFDANTARISFQAILTDNAGNALPGPVNLRFQIYTYPGGVAVGAAIDVNGVPVNDGVVDTHVPVPASSFDGTGRQMGVRVNLGVELTPRIQLTAVPYAYRVDRVESAELADSIDLGDAANCGTLDLFRTAANTPGITLTGCSSQISTFGGDGLEQIRLWGAGFGEMLLHDSTDNDITVRVSATTNSGGALTLYDATGGSALALTGGTGAASAEDRFEVVDVIGGTAFASMEKHAGGAWLTTFDEAGVRTAYVGSSASSGGFCELMRSNLTSVGLRLDGDDGNGGLVNLFQADGSIGVSIDGESAGGGLITARNSAGSSRVIIDGERSATTLDGEISVFDTSGTETVEIIGAETATTGGQILLRNSAGTVTIQLDAEFESGVTNDGRIVTEELQITGGSDLSEQFDIDAPNGAVEPGMVVSIDPARAGKLRVSNEAYDRTVAGIISGAGGVKPGMYMGQRGTSADGQHAVALTGRVYCWCDATMGAIQPGDLLTTSGTPGHAMKVADHGKAAGAIIGKAMTPLAEGKGLVLVLVSLQ